MYPSLWEGFGFPPLEAMDAGCPVLVSNTSSMPEVCWDAPFFFDPEDQASFASALVHAVNDEEARRQVVARVVRLPRNILGRSAENKPWRSIASASNQPSRT